MSTRNLMGILVLVALGMSSLQAQDRDRRSDRVKRKDKLVKIDPFNQDGRFFVTTNNRRRDFGEGIGEYFGNLGEGIGEYFGNLGESIGDKFSGKGRNYRYSVMNRSNRSYRTQWIDRHYPRRGTANFVNFYLGLNNFLEDGELPNSDSQYNLHPISSWYAALNFDNITRIYGPLYLEWGAGISTQDFSFENTRTRLIKDDVSIMFDEAVDITGRKSKINVSYVNVHFVPTISFGRYSDFRVGFGVYGGYKIGSFTKYKYDDINGDKQKEKQNDNLFINPFKYGFRAQVGWDFFDLFFNYDVTELFEEEKNAPRLNPVTFGIIF